MKLPLPLLFALLLLIGWLSTMAPPASAQVPVVTYYAPVVPQVVYRPTTVYSVPTAVAPVPVTAYAAPVPATTVYSVPAVVQPPQVRVAYDNGPLGLGFFPRRYVYYSPGYYVAPRVTVGFPAVGAVYP